MKSICKLCGVTWPIPPIHSDGVFMTVCPECANRPGQHNKEKQAVWTAELMDIMDECEKDPALLEYLRPLLERMNKLIERRLDEQAQLARNSSG